MRFVNVQLVCEWEDKWEPCTNRARSCGASSYAALRVAKSCLVIPRTDAPGVPVLQHVVVRATGFVVPSARLLLCKQYARWGSGGPGRDEQVYNREEEGSGSVHPVIYRKVNTATVSWHHDSDNSEAEIHCLR
jgi:hypothetical protein